MNKRKLRNGKPERLYYNRAFVKKIEGNKLSFGRSSYSRYSDWDYSKSRKSVNYLIRFLTKNLGKPIGDVYKHFCKMKFVSSEARRSLWNDLVYSDRRKASRFHYFYYDENGNLASDKFKQVSKKEEKSQFTQEHSKWNKTRYLPKYGKAYTAPKGNYMAVLIGHMRGYRYVNKFYVEIGDEVIKLPVYHVPYFDSFHNEEFIKIPGIRIGNNYYGINDNYYDYYNERVYRHEDEKTNIDYCLKYGNLGYGRLNLVVRKVHIEKYRQHHY